MLCQIQGWLALEKNGMKSDQCTQRSTKLCAQVALPVDTDRYPDCIGQTRYRPSIGLSWSIAIATGAWRTAIGTSNLLCRAFVLLAPTPVVLPCEYTQKQTRYVTVLPTKEIDSTPLSLLATPTVGSDPTRLICQSTCATKSMAILLALTQCGSFSEASRPNNEYLPLS